MKTKIRALLLAALLLATLNFQLSTFAQYAINWSTIDGGGGTSTVGPMIGVNYSVSGTIGQTDAGTTMTDGQYAVTGGFWAMPTALQVTNAPRSRSLPPRPGLSCRRRGHCRPPIGPTRSAAQPIPSSFLPPCQPSSIACSNPERQNLSTSITHQTS